MVAYSQALEIKDYFDDLEDEQEHYTLFTLQNVAHREFGVDKNGKIQKIHPESTISGEWDQEREWYYQKIREKLTQ